MIDEFIAMTQRITQREGFEGYLPTLLLPAKKDVRVLEDVPPEVDIEVAATKWAAMSVEPNEDFLLAFKINETSFKVVSRINGNNHENICNVQSA
jgi:hypothetical protein